jgi:hypothetical protein
MCIIEVFNEYYVMGHVVEYLYFIEVKYIYRNIMYCIGCLQRCADPPLASFIYFFSPGSFREQKRSPEKHL